MKTISQGISQDREHTQKATATWSVVLVISVICLMLQRGFGVSPQDWVDQLGLFPPEAWSLANAYRFLTYGLIHVETMHWLINVVGIALFGTWYERNASSKLLLGVFGIGVVTAGASHALVHPTSLLPLMGASGGVSVLAGAAIMLGQPFRALRAALTLFAATAVLSLAYEAVTGSQAPPSGGDAAHAAHLGGLATGILFAGVQMSRNRRLGRRKS